MNKQSDQNINKPLNKGDSPKSTSSAPLLVTADMNIADIMFKYPEAEEVLLDYGLHCAGCAANSFDTIEMGAKIHQMDDAEIAEMVERINEVISHSE